MSETWEPDIEQIAPKVIIEGELTKDECRRAAFRVIAEYQRQQAAAGRVTVKREYLQHMFDLLEQNPLGDYPFSYTYTGGKVLDVLATNPPQTDERDDGQ